MQGKINNAIKNKHNKKLKKETSMTAIWKKKKKKNKLIIAVYSSEPDWRNSNIVHSDYHLKFLETILY